MKNENIYIINNYKMYISIETFKLASGIYKELLIEVYDDEKNELGGYLLKEFRYKKLLKRKKRKKYNKKSL